MVSGEHPTASLIYANMVDEMYDHGYNGASLRRIAKSSGVTMATLYYHFPAKEAILVEIMRKTLCDLESEVVQARDSHRSAEESLRAMVTTHIRFHITRRKEAWVTDVEFKVLAEPARSTIKEMRDGYERMFFDVLSAGVDDGSFKTEQAGIATKAILTLCTSVAQWFRPDGPLPAESISATYVDLIFRALSPTATIEPAFSLTDPYVPHERNHP